MRFFYGSYNYNPAQVSNVVSVLAISIITVALAEIGDKTQIATSILGTQNANALHWVILGTTIGMLLANVPVVLIGKLSAINLNSSYCCCYLLRVSSWYFLRNVALSSLYSINKPLSL